MGSCFNVSTKLSIEDYRKVKVRIKETGDVNISSYLRRLIKEAI